MRRLAPRNGGSLFLKSEWLRLISMLFMLIVLYMMIQRARDESVWRWLVNDGGSPSAESVAIETARAQPQNQGPSFDGPTDLDIDESEAIQELFLAISDRTSLSVEEMPAYWRLWRWTRAQSLQDLRTRARRDLSLSHFLELPDKYRGQIVRLRLHLRRSLSWDIGPDEKAGGAKQVYEAWGWSDESPNFYCIAFTDPPPEMPIGPTVADEVTFYGYFLKLISYRDQQDKLRMAPLLIGRVERHAGLPPATDDGPMLFWVLAGGGIILVLVIVRWSRSYAFPAAQHQPVDKQAARASVSKWLTQQQSEDENEAWRASLEDDDSQTLDLHDRPTG